MFLPKASTNALVVGTTKGISGTSGSVLFVDSSSNINQNNANLFWDNTNNRLGIGTATPNTNLDINGFIEWAGQKRVSTQFDKTNDATLETVTGLSVTVVAGKTYQFKARLHVTADAIGGHKYAIAGTVTATAIVYQVNSISNAANAFVINSRQTALGGSVGQAGAVTPYTEIIGLITVNAGGTLLVQFAQNSATLATTSSVLVGSTFFVEQIN